MNEKLNSLNAKMKREALAEKIFLAIVADGGSSEMHRAHIKDNIKACFEMADTFIKESEGL